MSDLRRALFASWSGERDTRQVLCDIDRYAESGGDMDAEYSNGVSLLHYTAEQNMASEVERLIARGADPNIRDRYGETPLMYAVGCGSTYEHQDLLGTLSALLENGADVNAVDSKGFAALHRACIMSTASAARLLLEQGAMVNADTDSGETPLSLARKSTFGGRAEVVDVLLEFGAR